MQTFGEQIQECYRRVDDCTHGAARARNPTEMAGFLDMRSRWLLLAQSYEFLERLSRIADPSPSSS